MNFEAVKTILSKEITFKDDNQRYNFYKKIKKDKDHDDFTVQLAYALLLYDITYQSHMEKLKEKDEQLVLLTKENDEYMENELLRKVDDNDKDKEIQQLKEENQRLLQLMNIGK
tara:strand:- start:3113 stop:3454 length:342 start_codon:yes stop_codon:yes gene_type:complete